MPWGSVIETIRSPLYFSKSGYFVRQCVLGNLGLGIEGTEIAATVLERCENEMLCVCYQLMFRSRSPDLIQTSQKLNVVCSPPQAPRKMWVFRRFPASKNSAPQQNNGFWVLSPG